VIGSRLDRVALVTIALLASALAMGPRQAESADSDVQTVLTIDIGYLESTMPLYAEINAEVERLQADASAQRRSAIELARDVQISEILTALPEVIAAVAQSAHADLVLDRAVASRIGANAPRDVTSEIESALLARFGKKSLEPAP
jgi:hypothetical protein